MFEYVFSVKGMSCSMCEAHINEAVHNVCKARKVTSDRRRCETVVIANDLDADAVMKAINGLGYESNSYSVHPYEKKSLLSRLGGGRLGK